MIDWQYNLQKEVQNPTIIPYPPTAPKHNASTHSSNNTISIVVGAFDANNELFYSPTLSTVSPGATINWTNYDVVPHTVTSTDSSLDSGIISEGAAFTHTFKDPGLCDYFCIIHPHMKGKLIVKHTP
jgi:plastocyanin